MNPNLSRAMAPTPPLPSSSSSLSPPLLFLPLSSPPSLISVVQLDRANWLFTGGLRIGSTEHKHYINKTHARFLSIEGKAVVYEVQAVQHKYYLHLITA